MFKLTENGSSIARPPTRREIVCDVCFRGLTHVAAWLAVALVIYIVYEIGRPALPAIREYGFDFLKGRVWDPNQQQYGILPQIWGTFYSSILALVIGSIMGLAVAIFLSERFLSSVVFAGLKLVGLQHHRVWGRLPDSLEAMLKNLVELLAAIPSVVYGLWGIFVIIPLIRPGCDWLYDHLKVVPLFSTTLGSGGMLPAAVVLAIMIVPTVTAISRDALVSVPPKLREAAYGLGATRWEALMAVILPTARIGIFGAILLAFGRALGETMALAMLVGCRNVIDLSLFSPADTLAALMANSFSEAGPNPKLVGVLMYAALVLLGITLLVNVLGALLLQSTSRGAESRPLMEEPVLRHQAMAATLEAAEKLSIADLQRSLRRPRTLFNFILSALTTILTLTALVPLFSVVYMLVVKGMHRLTWESLTALPPAPLEDGGGFGNAILGTLVMVGLAGLISIPFGIVTAVFLAETGPDTRLAPVVRFGIKMLSGFPSILAGVLAYGAVVLVTGKFSAFAGGVALSVLMLPTVVLTAEDAIRMVPQKIKEAAIGMGATRTQVIWHVLLPTAMPGILTGVMLAVARAAGETAPLLFTALFSNFWINSRGHVDLMQGTASLAVLIYKFSGSSYDNQVEMAWAAALVLVVMVLAFNLLGQFLSNRSRS